MAPSYQNPFRPVTDDGQYLHTTSARRIPMGQMAGSDEYVNVYMAPQHGLPFSHLAGNGEYLHTAPMRGIPMGQMADSRHYDNAHMAPRGKHVMIA